jgi:uncharacterized caspase-like protein
VLVAFASKAGTTSEEDDGKHSPLTQALLNNLETPGLEINFLFRNVRDEVLETTRQHQVPFVYGSLSEEKIYLKQQSNEAPQTSDTESSDESEVPAEIAWSYLQFSEVIGPHRVIQLEC